MHYRSLNAVLEQYSSSLTHHPSSPNSLALHIDRQTQGYLKFHTPDGISLTYQDEPVSRFIPTLTSSAATPKAGRHTSPSQMDKHSKPYCPKDRLNTPPPKQASFQTASKAHSAAPP